MKKRNAAGPFAAGPGGWLYFDANSIGAMPKSARARVASMRPPDIVRFGISPLYHRAADVRELARRLAKALSATRWAGR